MDRRLIRPIDPPAEWAGLHYHPLSEICEFGAGIDIEALAGSMEADGYDPDEPIVLLDVPERKRLEVLNGRHRLQAAIKAEVVPAFAMFIGTEKQQQSYVRRKVLRQHLNESQRAMIAAKIIEMKHTVSGKFADSGPTSQASAAAALNVSERSVRSASKVLAGGTPELQKAVESGTIKVSTAAQAANETPEVQREIVKEAGPVLCKRCSRVGPLKNCPACAEAQAKADKPKLKKKGGIVKNLTAAARPLDWKWFDKNLSELGRFFLELKCRDKEKRDKLHRQLVAFSNAARVFQYEENPK